jgi:hypothetical protein
MRAELRAFLAYPVLDRWRLIQVWWLLLSLDLALRLLPFRKVQAWVRSSRPGKKSVDIGQTALEIHRAEEILDRAARHHLYPMTCLRRSLGLQWLLSKRGLLTDLCFGVRRENGQLQAHAWLEYQGQVIGEASLPEEQYARLVTR